MERFPPAHSQAMTAMGILTRRRCAERPTKRIIVKGARRCVERLTARDPAGPWGAEGGRVYATAVLALALQP